MNTGCKVTFPVDESYPWEPLKGETAWLRVKFTPNGLQIAEPGDKSIGHLEGGIAPQDINGLESATVYLSKAGGTHFAVAEEPLVAGDGFVGGALGKVKKEADLANAEGQVYAGGAAGSEITVMYF